MFYLQIWLVLIY